MANFEYVWIKCRTRHSSGPSSWEYREVARELGADPTAFLNEQSREYAEENDTYSEHFRGADADYEEPPLSWLIREEKHTKIAVTSARNYRNRVKALRRKLTNAT